ncbi:MAG: hypothetical protein WA118_13005 [Carboxydocellales bacterium]
MRYKRLRQRESYRMHVRTSKPNFHPQELDLPWYGFSPEVGQVFSHLDGTLAGTYQHEQGLLQSLADLD